MIKKSSLLFKSRHLVILFSVESLFFLTFVSALMIYLSISLSNMALVTKIFSATAFSLSVIILALLAIGVGITVKYYTNLIKSSGGTAFEGCIKDRIESLARKVGMISPAFVKAEKIPNAMAFGFASEKSFMIISPSFLQKLDDDELDCVTLHELFHIKYDVVSRSFNVVIDKLMSYPINMIPLFVVFIVCNMPLIVGDVMGYIQVEVTMSPETYTLFRAVLISAIAAAVISFISVVIILLTGGLMSRTHFYVRDLLADAYSAIITRKPVKLYSAIVKGTIEKPLKKDKYLNRVSFVDYTHETVPRQSPKFAEIYRVSIKKDLIEDFIKLRTSGYTSSLLQYRLKSLKIIDQLINNSLRINIIKQEKSLEFLTLSKLPESISSRLRNDPKKFEKIMEYTMQNSDRFNLIACANELQIDPFDVFASLVAAANQDILDIEDV